MTEDDGEILDIYTNSIRVSVGLYDVTLTFGISTPKSNGSVSEDIAIVRMSPQQAFSFKVAFNKTLELYKEKYGEITLPKELLTQLETVNSVETPTV